MVLMRLINHPVLFCTELLLSLHFVPLYVDRGNEANCYSERGTLKLQSVSRPAAETPSKDQYVTVASAIEKLLHH